MGNGGGVALGPRGAASSPIARLRIVLEMIKIEHTLFALPFAFTGAILAAHGIPSAKQIVWILVAMVGARSAAMAFNRLIDRDYDARNPRTRMRALPAGLVSPRFVWGFTGAAGALFVLASWQLNALALALSPAALVVVFFYSWTKRFTPWSHAFLGLALSIAPVGAWIAVRGTLEGIAPALLLASAVVCWLIGFDIIYALQDVEFDRNAGLYSIPGTYGEQRSLVIARIFHFMMIAFLAAAGLAAGRGIIYFTGVGICALLIAAEHCLVKPGDLRRLNIAFFNLNSIVSAGIFIFTALDIWRFP